MSATKLSHRSGYRGRGRGPARQLEASVRRSRWDDVPIHDVWRQYQKKRDEELRNYLIEKYLPLVRYNAERIYARLPDEVDVEDLMSAGLFGLMDAIDGYDLERKVKFETFSAPRIKGAILDELRAMDWVPRLVRHRTAKVEHARQQIEMEAGRPATEDEVAQRLGVDDVEFDKIKRDATVTGTISMTRRTSGEDGGDFRELDVIKEGSSNRSPVQELQRKDLRGLLTKGLTRAERLIVILYYYEGMTMKEIGTTLDLSESRVSQMHSSILLRLKVQMQHRSRELESAS